MTAVCEIVNHYIRTTVINFRTAPQDPSDWTADWQKSHTHYPWLVASRDRRVVGLAYVSPWHTRAAYDWCVESTVYVAADAARRGIGRALYEQLMALADQQGFHTQVAVIGLPNDASVGLHETFGFRHIGTLTEIGYKFGRWHDVGFWQRHTEQRRASPAPIGPIPGLNL